MLLEEMFSGSIEEDGMIGDLPLEEEDAEKEQYSKKAQLVTIGEFAIFDEDNRYHEADLEEIIRVNNFRIEDTGDEIPIILGHTKEGVSEEEQPQIVGWASKLRMGMIGSINPRKTVVATFRILKECVELVKNYPRRSVELWTTDKVIDPIALLSTSRPAKNLGLMTFEQVRTGDRLTKYYEQGADMDQTNNVIADRDTLVKLITSTLEQSEIGQYVRTQMTKPEPELEAGVEQPQDGEQDAEDTEIDAEALEDADADKTEDKQEVAEDGAPQDPPVPKGEEDQTDTEKTVVKKSAKCEAEGEVEQSEEEDDDEDLDDDPRLRGLGREREEHPELSTDELLQIVDDHLGENPEYYSAGGDNTAIPDEKIVEKKSMPDAIKAATIERYAKDNEALRSEVEKLGRELSRVAREKELFQLNTRFAFDLADEMKLVEDFNDAQFVRHCEVIKGRYAEYPINRGAKVAPVTTEEGVKPSMTLDKVQKAVTLATTLKCSFEEALKQV